MASGNSCQLLCESVLVNCHTFCNPQGRCQGLFWVETPQGVQLSYTPGEPVRCFYANEWARLFADVEETERDEPESETRLEVNIEGNENSEVDEE